MVAIDGNNVWVSNFAIQGGIGPGAGTEVYGPSNRLVEISSITNKVIARVPTAGYPVESFLARNNTLLMVGNDFLHGQSMLIRTDWPYQTLTYMHPLAGSSFNVVDTHGSLWIPSWDDRTLQILPNSVPLPNNPHPGD